jgi:hypothetical protein
MKSSSSSSVDAALFPFNGAVVLDFYDVGLLALVLSMKSSSSSSVDAALLPFDGAVLLDFDDAGILGLVLGMKRSSSSSLSWLHNQIFPTAAL